MEKRTGETTMKGNPVTLLGPRIKEGDKAPDATLVDTNLQPVALKDYKGKVVVLATVPSLDTPVCDMETRRFNEAAGKLGDDVVVLTVSTDLPFAQKRWCGAAGVEAVVTLSDHRDTSLGLNYGVLIEGLRLLARAVFVLDKDQTVRYVQLVKEIGEEPDLRCRAWRGEKAGLVGPARA